MKIIITGSAGFIGFHASKLFLSKGFEVVGIDSLTRYYDVNLKKRRNEILKKFKSYSFYKIDICDDAKLKKVFKKEKPDVVIHLAAQAGVRYSIENPKSYVESNFLGTFNILEAIKENEIKHSLIASTSSVYGANEDMPFEEKDKADLQLSFYASTKKSCEVISHSYSHLYNLPITCFRFFTVYGPWGRPDMALFKFTKSILEEKPIDVYNFGKMRRDFTYVDDLVESIFLLIDKIPCTNTPLSSKDSISSVAPWRLINIGNSKQEKLEDFIKEIETHLNKKAVKNLMEMQPGDVPATFADISLLKEITGYIPDTTISKGIKLFLEWYKNFYEHK